MLRAEFMRGSTQTDPSAELYGGWSLVLNALKDYANSNTQAAQALGWIRHGCFGMVWIERFGSACDAG